MPSVGDKVVVELKLDAHCPSLRRWYLTLPDNLDRDYDGDLFIEDSDIGEFEIKKGPLPTKVGTQIIANVGAMRDLDLIRCENPGNADRHWFAFAMELPSGVRFIRDDDITDWREP